MKDKYLQWSELTDAYLRKTLSQEDVHAFENEIQQNTELYAFVQQQKIMMQGIQLAERKRLKANLFKNLELERELQEAQAESPILKTIEANRTTQTWSITRWINVQYRVAAWVIVVSIFVVLASTYTYKAVQKHQNKQQFVIDAQQAEDLLEQPRKKIEITIPKAPITELSTRVDEEAENQKKPVEKMRSETLKKMDVSPTIEDKKESPILVLNRKKDEDKDKNESDTTLTRLVMDDVVHEKEVADVKTEKLSDEVTKGMVYEDAKKTKTQKNNVKEYYMPILGLGMQNEWYSTQKNKTANPKNLPNSQNAGKSDKAISGPKVWVTQYTNVKPKEDGSWVYDFISDFNGNHLFIYADFNPQELKLYSNNKGATQYYLKTSKGVYKIYPNQSQRKAEVVTEPDVLKYTY